MEQKFSLGMHVDKVEGYKFHGVVVAYFINSKSEPRYVVESTIPGAEGWLMIFNEAQLQETIIKL